MNDKNLKRVLILLSTYNGERFLDQQLDSIYAQENVDYHILARDDGSSDTTLDVLHNYSQNYGRMTIIEGENVGAACSFFSLIKYAVDKMPRYDYYAFCDQDDVWYNDKLARAVRCLQSSSNLLKLYFSMANLCDADNKIIGKTSMPRDIGYHTVFFNNPALGCTQVLSYDLLCMGLDVPYIISHDTKKQRALLHDAWIYDVASFTDAFMMCDDRTSMSYRQHGSNVTTYKKSWFQKYKFVIKNINKYRNARYQESWLLKKYEDRYSEEKRDYLNMFCHYKDNWFKTVLCAFKANLKCRALADRVLFRLMIVTRTF